MSIERRAVECRGRWVVVSIDDARIQCTVHAYGGGRFVANGYGEKAIMLAAEYSRQHGTSYPTRAEADEVCQ
jgi:hypothetical protein